MARLVDLGALDGKVFSTGWRTSRGGTITTTEPATGRVLATVGLADAGDVNAAAQAARQAQPGWASMPPADRAATMRRAAQLMADNQDEVLEWLVREGGAVPGKARFEIKSTEDELWAASALPTQSHGRLLPSVPGCQSIGRQVPLGWSA
jgi:benzaldehyde dehydrogenase (NAD)